MVAYTYTQLHIFTSIHTVCVHVYIMHIHMHLYVHIYKYTHCTNVLRCRVISVFISECDIDFLCGSKALHLLSHCSVMLSSLSQTSCKSQANVCDLFCSWQLQLRKKGIRMWTLSSIDRTLVINLRIQHFISARTAVSHSGLTSVSKGWATVAVPPGWKESLLVARLL